MYTIRAMISQHRSRASGRPYAAIGGFFFALAMMAPWAVAQGDVDYARDVLPILSENCYHCHGPAERGRKAKLRLDLKEGAFRTKDDVTVIVPGKPGESELVRRISSGDPDDVMPPAKDIRKLTAKQIDTLRRWVEQGATWGTHWAYIAPKTPAIPEGGESGRPRNPIDAFVLEHLSAEQLEPSPEADRVTLIRRVSLDLTGLPPTPAEVDAFAGDESSDAYEKLVDRLLASPRYGERMASDWLDLARYADTHGYQMDRYRPMWPWRDWVIKAFNDNLPYDQFVTWQLAGDLMPKATKEQRLATGFNRHHMQNEEGGVVAEEFRVAYVVDRVNTMGTAFLGLTLECARCHDHKFDPITQRDFYSLFAFFQNVDESGQTSFFTEATPTPTLLLSTDAQDSQLATLRSEAAAKQQAIAAQRQHANQAFHGWLSAKGDVSASVAGTVARFTFDEPATTQPANTIDGSKPAVQVEGPESIDGKIGKAALLNGENGFVFPGGVGHFSRADSFSMSLWVQTPAHAPRMVVVHKSRGFADAAGRGYELLLEDGRVAFGLHHFWPGNSLKVVTKQAVPAGAWTHVAVTYDGSSRAAGLRLYVDGRAADVEILRDKLTKDITYGGAEPDLAIGHRFRDNGFKGGNVDEFSLFDRSLTPIEIAHLAGKNDLAGAWCATPESLTAAQRDDMFEYFLAVVYPPSRQLARELADLRRAENALVMSIPEAMVMQEMPTTKPAFILKRGAYDAPGDAVGAATPGFLPPFPADQPRNRLGLARWLLDPANPLTARVTVNRAWQQMFGRGIMETSDNFGVQGAQPSHPALLDWLAREFADSMDWDMKRLLKTIALSATYRRSSRAVPEVLGADPANVHLSRGPSRRLTAEMLRDQALSASGLLIDKIGGPSVRPYQPDGLWNVAMGNPPYNQDKGEGLYRRSLYTFWKRTVPPPAMTVFDAADKNNCTVKRQSTSTPLQALTLLNDPQIVEAARFVSQRMLNEGGATTEDRVAWAFRLAVGRNANEGERTVLARLYREQHDLFTADPQAASKLLSVGEKPNDPNLDPADLAAGTILGIALFNHDGAMMRR